MTLPPELVSTTTSAFSRKFFRPKSFLTAVIFATQVIVLVLAVTICSVVVDLEDGNNITTLTMMKDSIEISKLTETMKMRTSAEKILMMWLRRIQEVCL